jgi:hypothetical protein
MIQYHDMIPHSLLSLLIMVAHQIHDTTYNSSLTRFGQQKAPDVTMVPAVYPCACATSMPMPRHLATDAPRSLDERTRVDGGAHVRLRGSDPGTCMDPMPAQLTTFTL